MKNTHILERKSLPQSRIRLQLQVLVQDFLPSFERELMELSKEVRLPGFRPGKAPMDKVLAALGHARVEAGALDRAINAVYIQVVQEEKLIPLTAPNLTLDQYTAPKDGAAPETLVAKFTVEVDVLPEFELKGYDKLKLKSNPPAAVSDKDLDDVIQYLRKQQAVLKELADGVVAAKGMWAELSYEGSIDGVVREEMKSSSHPLMLGDGNMIPGFEDEIYGLKKGEEKTFKITFPKDYHSESVKGKKAEFKVKLLDLKDVILPVVDEKFATSFGHKNVGELEQAISASLVKEREDAARMEQEEQILEELLKIAKFELPESLLEREKARLAEETNKRLEKIRNYRQVMEKKEAAAGETEKAEILHEEEREGWTEEMKKDLEVQAEKNVRIGLALGKVIELEGLEKSEHAMRDALSRLIELATKK